MDEESPARGARPRFVHSGPAWHWAPLVALLAIFGAILIWLVIPGTRIFPPSVVERVADDSSQAALVEESNRALEERARRLEEALAGAVCTPEGDLVLPDGRRPDGLLPIDGGGEARLAPDALLPPSPQDVSVTQEEHETLADGTRATRRSETDLLSLIERQTALVLVSGSETASGSGFFVGPDLLVTNHHVVAPALAGGRIVAINESLGGPREARVIAQDGPLETTGGDFALLKVDGASQPFFTLRSSEETMRLQNVISAGYPGIVLQTDSNFAALLSGDASAMPTTSVTNGIVNNEQDFPTGTRVLIHNAAIAQGNSGGPLIDYCGRAVGINTFVRSGQFQNLDSELNINFNFAIASTDLLRFLESTPAAPSASGSPCSPTPVASADAQAGNGQPSADPDGSDPGASSGNGESGGASSGDGESG